MLHTKILSHFFRPLSRFPDITCLSPDRNGIIPFVKPDLKRELGLAASAVALALAMPPIETTVLAWFALVPLLVSLWSAPGPGKAFRTGLLYGTVYHLCVTYWVYHSMRIYGGVPVPAAVAGTLLLAIFLGSYVGLFSLGFRYLIRTSGVPALLTAPALWVALDLLRNYFLTGFPWGALGYSQYKMLTLVQISDLTGVYGVTFLVVAVNGAVADIVLYRRRLKELPLFPSAPTVAGIVVLALVAVGITLYGTRRIELYSSPAPATARIAVVQGNIDQGLKWNPDHRRQIMEKYRALTHGLRTLAPDLIVWPETSVPFVYGAREAPEDELRRMVREGKTPLLFGAARVVPPEESSPARRPRLANSALLLDREGRPSGLYDKMHLVPFGEYVPWGLPLGRLVTAVGDFVPGTTHSVLESGPLRLGIAICYEIIFPNLVRRFAANGANVLVTITNDAWFGHTSAPYQHFVAGVFRAVENRTPVVRAANTGISGFVDPAGRILWKSDIFTEATNAVPVGLWPPAATFYCRYGDIFAYLCSVTSILLLLLRTKRRA